MGSRRGGIYGVASSSASASASSSSSFAAAEVAGSRSTNTSNISSPSSTISIAGASASTSSAASCHLQQYSTSTSYHYDTRNVLSQQDAGSFRCEEEDCLYLCSSIVGDSSSSSSSSSSATYYRSLHALLQLVQWLYTKGKRGSSTTKSLVLSLESSVGILFRSYRIRKSLLEVLSTKMAITTTQHPSSSSSSSSLFTLTLATFFALLTNIVQKISSSKPSNTTSTANDTLVSFLDSPFLSSSINTHFTTQSSTSKDTNDSITTTSDLELLQEAYSTVSRLAYLLFFREYPTRNRNDPAELVSPQHIPWKTTQKKENVEGTHYGDTLLLTTTAQPHSSPSSSHSVGSDPTRLGRSRRGKRRAFLNHDRDTTTTTTTTSSDAPLSCTIPTLPENDEVTHNVDASFQLLDSITTCTNNNKRDKNGEQGHWNSYTTVENHPNKPCNGILRRRYRRRNHHHHQRQPSNDSFSFVVDDANGGKNSENLYDMENTTKKLFYDTIVPIILDLWNQQQCNDHNNENNFSLVDFFPTYLTTRKEKKDLQVQQQQHHQKEEEETITTRKKKPTPFLEIICGYLTLKSMEQMCIHNNTNILHFGNEGEHNEDPNGFQSHNNDVLCHYLIRQSGCLTAHAALAIHTCIDLTRHILDSLPEGKLYRNSGHCQHCSTKDTPTFAISTPSSTFAFKEQSTICPFCLSLLQKRLESILSIIDCSVLTPQNRSVVTSTTVSTIIPTLEEMTTTSTSTSLVQSLFGLVKVCHFYMLRHCCRNGALVHHNQNVDDTQDTTKTHDKPWVQNIIRSCLSVLTSVGHENCHVGEDILAAMTVTSTEPPTIPVLFSTGYDLILDLLYSNACEFSMSSCNYTVSKDDVSVKKEKIPSYDTCIFCLNILTNTIETMGEIAKTRIMNYSLQEDRYARMTGISWHNLHNQCAAEGRMDSTSSENNDSFLRWLTNWIGNLIRVAFQSSTSADCNHIKGMSNVEGRRRRTCNDTNEREQKKDDDVLSQKEVECLVLAGNGCILLTWLMKKRGMDQIHSQEQNNSPSHDDVCSTRWNRDVCGIVIPELTQVVLLGTQNQNETSEDAIDVVVKTLKAFLNYYVFSVGECSIVVVDPILKLLSDLEAMKEVNWIQELCKV